VYLAVLLKKIFISKVVNNRLTSFLRLHISLPYKRMGKIKCIYVLLFLIISATHIMCFLIIITAHILHPLLYTVQFSTLLKRYQVTKKQGKTLMVVFR
jgi:hypothetical protein